VRDPDELDEDVLDELDLDGDGVGAADPDHGRPVVEQAVDKAEQPEKAGGTRDSKETVETVERADGVDGSGASGSHQRSQAD
jgi:hypothetical protein avisC_06579